MANGNMMSCTIEPELTISPGSIAGPGGSVDMTFSVTTANCTRLTAEYEILGSAAYRIVDAKGSPTYRVTQNAAGRDVARKLHRVENDQARYTQPIWLERLPDSAAEASLKVVVTVWGAGQGKLDPVFSIGSIAILSAGLRKLAGVPLSQDMSFSEARDLVAKLKPQLLAKYAELRDLDWPTNETIANAVLGETNSLKTTHEKLGPAIDLLKREVTKGIPDKYIGKVKAILRL